MFLVWTGPVLGMPSCLALGKLGGMGWLAAWGAVRMRVGKEGIRGSGSGVVEGSFAKVDAVFGVGFEAGEEVCPAFGVALYPLHARIVVGHGAFCDADEGGAFCLALGELDGDTGGTVLVVPIVGDGGIWGDFDDADGTVHIKLRETPDEVRASFHASGAGGDEVVGHFGGVDDGVEDVGLGFEDLDGGFDLEGGLHSCWG